MELTSGQKVFYCGKLCWVYIGDDPESGSPVLKDTITKKFIVADINRISLPEDLKLVMRGDVGDAINQVYSKPENMVYDMHDLPFMVALSASLYDLGYTDGNQLCMHTMLGIITNAMNEAVALGAHSSGDFEYAITEGLFDAGIRKNKIVVADVRV
ncbi:hypothetical protein VPDG_00058 [Vibrio phage henriette 12B8]|uniref:hypothetical protein n=1 Tax=Vibrio phage henriette 12B8 TaxID=573174 RepID=UPI0002C14BB0|nr:hypothetical protein VPDG_00058 [Vibrio phage henriette 12B8]AGG58219.1 hypothetical protein VPDG_00058 [Vibrio phage henriette 12B8]